MPKFVTRAKITSVSRRAKWILYPICALATLNFAVFWLVSVYSGGDAFNGYATAQHYFICAHGACREVGEGFWRYSYWHAISSMIGIASVFIVITIFVNTGDIDLEFNARA